MMQPARHSTRAQSCWAWIIRAARDWRSWPHRVGPDIYKLPRPMLHSGDLDFSFSGLKTAVLTLVKQQACSPHPNPLPMPSPQSSPASGRGDGREKQISISESLREFQIPEQTQGRHRLRSSGSHRRCAGAKGTGRAGTNGPGSIGGGGRRGCEPVVARTPEQRHQQTRRQGVLSRPGVLHRQRRDDRFRRRSKNGASTK